MKNAATLAIILLYGTDFVNSHPIVINNNLDQEIVANISDLNKHNNNTSQLEQFIFTGKCNQITFKTLKLIVYRFSPPSF